MSFSLQKRVLCAEEDHAIARYVTVSNVINVEFGLQCNHNEIHT